MCFFDGGGGVNMHEAQIYIKNIKKQKYYTEFGKGCVVSQLGGGIFTLLLVSRDKNISADKLPWRSLGTKMNYRSQSHSRCDLIQSGWSG